MKKLYDEASVRDIAEAIREKNGSTAGYKIAQMGDAVRAIAGTETLEWHQCPEAVRRYLDTVSYDPTDYGSSQIDSYADGSVLANPIAGTLGGVAHCNEVPYILTPYLKGAVKPLDRLRWISSPERNIRDLGGWACDGGTIKYGKLFRGGEVYAADTELIKTLHDEIGIRAELELQGTDVNEDYSVIGADVDFCCPTEGGAYWAYYTLKNEASMREAFRFILDSVRRDRPLYFHCSAGADRTGTIACLIEALLGVSQSDIDKDYELTSFNGSDYLRKRCGREYAAGQWEYGYKNLITAITALEGGSLRDKAVNYLARLGFTAAELNEFRAGMIDGTPETLSPSLRLCSVTYSLANAASDNAADSLTQYQPYAARISAANGYVISAVSVRMGGEEITGSAWTGAVTNLRRRAAAQLTNCSSDNDAKAVIDGQSYAARIRADKGYTLDGAQISITMGGTDVSKYYSEGAIAIPRVTGDLVITVTAVPTAPAYTNLFKPAEVQRGQRITSGATLEASAVQNVSNDIELGGTGVTVRIKGSKANTDAGSCRVCYFNGSTWTGAVYFKNLPGYSYDSVTDTISFTSSDNALYTKMRFAFPSSAALDGIVVTINEVIE